MTQDVRDLIADARGAMTERDDTGWFWVGRLVDALEVSLGERDAAVAALQRVREQHRKYRYYELEDSCPDTSESHREERHHESDEIGEFYCEDTPTGYVVCDACRDVEGERMDWPCPTIMALEGDK